MKPEELKLTTFRINVQTLSRTQNCDWLNEISTENPGWIKPKTAAERDIKDGDRITFRSQLGEIETTATAKVTMTLYARGDYPVESRRSLGIRKVCLRQARTL